MLFLKIIFIIIYKCIIVYKEGNLKNKASSNTKINLTLSPTKTEIDNLLSNVDDSILLTINAIDNTVEDEVVSELGDEVNEYMTPLSVETKSINKSNKLSNEKIISNLSLNNSNENAIKSDRSNINITDSSSLYNEEVISIKLNSSTQINSSKQELESNKVEKNLKQAIDKELSFNYLDENESLFSSLVNKETLLKEYIDIRKKIEKYILNNSQNSLDINLNEEIGDLDKSENNNYSTVEIVKHDSVESPNTEIKNILNSFDKLMEKVIENEKVIIIYMLLFIIYYV